MYSYKNIAFRPIEKADLEELRMLHNDQSTLLNLATTELVDEHGQIDWWESLHKVRNDKRYAICMADDPGKIIGRLRIQNIDRQNSNCEIGLDIIKDYRGKGYGLLSYKMTLEFLFLHYNMNMVYVRVAEFNSGARSLYEKAGFRETGFLKDFIYRNGKYNNYIILCLTRQEYLKDNR